MAKLSVKGRGRRAVIKCCIATLGISPRMFKTTLPNLFINASRDSPFSCQIFINAMAVRRWGLLVTNCAVNFVFKVSKESIDWG